MVTSAVLATVLLLIANADRLESLKASFTGGLEARTRKIVEDAQATLEQVRATLKIAAQANLSLAARAGRWGPVFLFDEKEAMLESTKAALERLGVPATERAEIFRDYHDTVRFDYAMAALGQSTPPAVHSDPRVMVEWTRLHQGLRAIPTADEVQAFLNLSGVVANEVQLELLKDLRHYEKHHEHRRRNEWRELHDRT
jgi:hypothetical protein